MTKAIQQSFSLWSQISRGEITRLASAGSSFEVSLNKILSSAEIRAKASLIQRDILRIFPQITEANVSIQQDNDSGVLSIQVETNRGVFEI